MKKVSELGNFKKKKSCIKLKSMDYFYIVSCICINKLGAFLFCFGLNPLIAYFY